MWYNGLSGLVNTRSYSMYKRTVIANKVINFVDGSLAKD